MYLQRHSHFVAKLDKVMPPADTQQRAFPSVILVVGISDSYFYLLKFYSYFNEQLKYLLL